ncbi:formyltransferase family protein [Chitinophaga arvensicola]|uniref:Methionyl-tRNA formyltransferase n=1 Tax=Chitinophaga arvensicola TaxID=29529 RepID=A0A1I0NQ23_9BACT|nr:formyltransferase family protein [Chitinophaga arvensicola]SEW03407.1 methionyl-tRNA formyltransferase [Chitinophaga arvensicola]
MIIVANSNPVHKWLEEKSKMELDAIIISSKEELVFKNLETLSPEFIFFPHWSSIIPSDIYDHFNCVVFHMTDLPYGRGGSPLQNLIVRGKTKTMISALKVEKGIDTGDIYLKKELSLAGTAEEIFMRAGKVIYEMMKEILETRPALKKQQGEPLLFKRRTPAESNLKEVNTLENAYDFIRMLDAEGYPHAFIENEYFRFEFTRASLKSESIIADVRIIKK